MQVILLERIERLGSIGDVVTVKDGFGRNYLLPQGKALRATARNLEQFENQRAFFEAENLQKRASAEEKASILNGAILCLLRQSSETGHLYGSVSATDIAQAITDKYCALTKSQVILDRPIKSKGVHKARLMLHPEITTLITISVAQTEEEAHHLLNAEG